MAKIGHSSIDERGKASGGQAGDQNGREVCFSSWYDKKWGYVLRPKDKTVAERMATACEKGCSNDMIGYDQNQRNSLKTQAVACGMDLSKIKTPCECDCSSFMTVCAECAGIKIPYNGANAPTTSTMQKAFMSTGAFDLLTDSKYLTSDKYLKRGDVIVKPGSHTIMCLEDGSKVNETQTTTLKAVDISKYNIIGNYKVMVAEVSNIIIRVGYRSKSSGNIVEDDSFIKHTKGCIDNNANLGFYFYDQSLNENEANEQAEWVINKIKPYSVKLPIFIDSEYSCKEHDGRADNISKEQRTRNIIAFCEKIKSAGFTPGVYASDSWFKSMVEFDKLKGYVVWCARYSTQKPTISKYDIWQYGSEMYTWATGAIDTNNIYNLNGAAPTNNTGSLTPNPTNNAGSSGLTPEKPILLMGRVNIDSGTLNVRKLPTTDSPIVIQLPKDGYIQLRGDLGTWYRMDVGYVSKKYVAEVHGIITGDKVRLRSTPNTAMDSNVITNLMKNTEVIICTSGNGWYYVLLDSGQLGWVSGQYIRLK